MGMGMVEHRTNEGRNEATFLLSSQSQLRII